MRCASNLLRRAAQLSRQRLLPPVAAAEATLYSTSATVRDRKEREGFFASFFTPKIEIQHTSHSQSLTSTERLIEYQVHDVQPSRVEDYEIAQRNLVQFVSENRGERGLQLDCTSIGNYRVILGNNDQYVHMWSHENGNATLDKDIEALKISKEYAQLTKEVSWNLVGRSNQILLPFSFWPKVYNRTDREHIYEIRNYNLKPGTMVEWGNYWAKGINMRDYKHNEAFLGMFSQVGDLYNVKHIWCYDSLADRKEAREVVWQKQQMQWSEIIAGTMPLIQDMSSRIMVSLDYSPTK